MIQTVRKFISPVILLFSISSCSIFQNGSKHGLTNGYHNKFEKGSRQKVYVELKEDTINIYQASQNEKLLQIDTPTPIYQLLPETEIQPQTTILTNPGLDLDLITIPLKLRPAQFDVEPQLNANINGAIYLGYRIDRYRLKYNNIPLGGFERDLNHTAISMGFFSGLGNTFMSPTNTNFILDQEYDGLAWSNGVACIIGINGFSAGLGAGFDNLLDNNRDIWIYERKIWYGLLFSLHIN